MTSPVRATTRPLTANGVAGVRPATARRQIKDSNYYKNLLRSKLTEISNALSSKEREEIRLRCSVKYMKELDEKESALQRRLKESLGQLRDINRCIDAVQYQEPVIRFDPKILHESEVELGNLVSERNRLEAEQGEKRKRLEGLDACLDDLHADEDAVGNLNQLRDLTSRIARLNADRKRIDESSALSPETLSSEVRRVKTLLDSTSEEIKILSLPLTEQRDAIIKLMKTLNSENQELEDQEKSIGAQADSIDLKLDEMKTLNPDILVMQRRDAEMTSFMDNCGAEMNSLRDQLNEKQKEIHAVSLELKSYSDIQLIESESQKSLITNTILHRKVEAERKALVAVSSVESLYATERNRLEGLLQQQRDSLTALDDIEECTRSRIRQNEADEKLIQDVSNRISETKSKLHSLSGDVQRKQAELARNPIHVHLADLDERLEIISRKADELEQRYDPECLGTRRELVKDLVSKINRKLCQGT